MSQRALEAALGKLICDDAFRREFYQDPEGAVTHAGFELTSVELSSLRRVDVHAVEAFVSHVDDRVRRAEEPELKRPANDRVPGSQGRRS